MPEFGPSINERWSKICKELTENAMMVAGDGGFTGAADPQGPVAGYDPVMGNGLLKRTLTNLKKKRKKKTK